MKTIAGIEGYKALVGEQLGESDWLRVDQERINQFADATGDHQWIHVDVEKARQGPFGTTIAHGFLTLSLIPGLTGGLLKIDGVRMGINYGLNRVRFPSPVKVDSRVKASVRNLSVEDVQDPPLRLSRSQQPGRPAGSTGSARADAASAALM